MKKDVKEKKIDILGKSKRKQKNCCERETEKNNSVNFSHDPSLSGKGKTQFLTPHCLGENTKHWGKDNKKITFLKKIKGYEEISCKTDNFEKDFLEKYYLPVLALIKKFWTIYDNKQMELSAKTKKSRKLNVK